MKELFEVFYVFFGIGALTFGGGYTMLPLLQKNVVTKRAWITEAEVTDCYAVAQCLPGIIAANTAMLIGHKHKGYPGMIAATLGVITPSIIIILIIAMFIQNLLAYEWVNHAFNGIRAAVLALITDAVIKMWKSGVKDISGIIIFAASLILFSFVPVSPAMPLLAGAVCGVVIKEREQRRKNASDQSDSDQFKSNGDGKGGKS